MATNTYVALDKKTITSTAASVEFTSIPQNYTDLVLVVNFVPQGSGGATLTINNDSGLYSYNALVGLPSNAPISFAVSNYANSEWISSGAALTNANNLHFDTFHFMNYSSTNTFKTILQRENPGQSGYVGAWAHLYRSTNAITSIQLALGTSFGVGSTLSLYGIREEGVSPTTKATGGAVYSDDVYYYHVFGASGTFTPTQSITAQVLVVGTGGVGGVFSGGGGAGGSIGYSSSASLASGTAYTATIGASGTVPKVNSSGSKVQNATASTNCTFSGSGISTITGTAGGNGTDNGAGGSNLSFSGGSGSGGGGAGFGANGSAGAGGAGGAGVSTYSSWGQATGLGQNISGTHWFAGGGGGGTGSGASSGAGGNGGGGAGGADGFSGRAYTGGGGGGAKNSPNYGDGGAGGTGVVIVRYAK
jgi:hypothetical protein